MAKKDQSDAKQPAKTKTKDKAKVKGKQGKQGKQGKNGKGAAAGGLSVAGHPRAAAAVKRAKGFGGIAGFVLAAYASYKAGVPPEQIGLRALAFGVAGYMLAWACSVTIWRHLVLAELRAAVESGQATLQSPAGRAGNGAARGDRSAAAKAPAGAEAEPEDEGKAGDE
ncbi:MAG: hypothetical protein ACRDL8_03590 [Solirubrobacteraceae bacterium]